MWFDSSLHDDILVMVTQMKSSEVEDKAIKYVISYEKSRKRNAKDDRGMGNHVDVISDGCRFIEVKGFHKKIHRVTLGPDNYKALKNHKNNYWLYALSNISSKMNMKKIDSNLKIMGYQDIMKNGKEKKILFVKIE